jgi:hypothetical protein
MYLFMPNSIILCTCPFQVHVHMNVDRDIHVHVYVLIDLHVNVHELVQENVHDNDHFHGNAHAITKMDLCFIISTKN